jgi:hypothetical protein
MIALRQRAKSEARKAWAQVDQANLDGTYPVGMLALSVSVLQRDAARLSAAYIQAFVSSELGRPIDVPLVDARQVGSARNGDELRKALRSPLIGVKVGIRDGKDVPAALAEGGRTLERIVGLATDTAAREALRLASDHSTHILGWRRAIRGTCGACMGAATSEMHPADGELDIHPNCACVAEPVVKAEPYNPKKGENVEVQNAHELIKGKWVKLENPIRGKIEKFNDKTVMINAGTKTKPRWITATRENTYKPVKAVAQKVDDLPHSLNPYELKLTDKEIKAFDSYKGYGYQNINGALRAGKPGGPTADVLDGALQKGSLGQDTTLYRFMHLPEGTGGVGDMFLDKAFSSTALKRGALQRGQKGKVLMRIKANAGQKGGFIRGQHEEEFLLPRGTRFRIVKETRESDGRRVFDVEIMK